MTWMAGSGAPVTGTTSSRMMIREKAILDT
jgi:hypothetical protein